MTAIPVYCNQRLEAVHNFDPTIARIWEQVLVARTGKKGTEL